MTSVVSQKPAPTRLKGGGIITVAPGGEVISRGIDRNVPGIRRQLFVTNFSIADYVLICDSGKEVCAVPAGITAAMPSVITIITDSDIVVRVPATATAPVVMIVGEIFDLLESPAPGLSPADRRPRDPSTPPTTPPPGGSTRMGIYFNEIIKPPEGREESSP